MTTRSTKAFTARAEVLEESRASLQTLLGRANTVEEVLMLQKKLNRLTQEAESQRQRASRLVNQAKYSTLTLQARFYHTSAPLIDDLDSKWTPMTSINNALDDLASFCRGVIDGVLYLLVWIIPLALACLGFGAACAFCSEERSQGAERGSNCVATKNLIKMPGVEDP